MTSRFLSVGLAAVLLVGLAVGAWGQQGRGQPKPDDPATAPAAGDETTGEAGAPFGSADGTGSKDAFDVAAAKAKSGGKAGDSLGNSAPKLERATFGAGCFWHVEAEFEWLRGVKSAVSGYAGGDVANPSYEMVHEGDTGHIEVVQVEYDPSIISYEQLLKVFWHGHDPTQWNRQGPDFGTQYRSAIFYHSEAQRKAALKSYRELTAARAYRAPIVTLLLPMKAFYRAEEYHQNYYGGKPDMPVGRSSRVASGGEDDQESDGRRVEGSGSEEAGRRRGEVRRRDRATILHPPGDGRRPAPRMRSLENGAANLDRGRRPHPDGRDERGVGEPAAPAPGGGVHRRSAPSHGRHRGEPRRRSDHGQRDRGGAGPESRRGRRPSSPACPTASAPPPSTRSAARA